MSLPLTPEVLCGAYKFLALTAPFRAWNLPDPDLILFRVVRDPAIRGHYRAWSRAKHAHEIAVSARTIGYTANLIATMAHEMIHLHQKVTCMETRGAEHNAAFHKLAARICKIHGFDPKLF